MDTTDPRCPCHTVLNSSATLFIHVKKECDGLMERLNGAKHVLDEVDRPDRRIKGFPDSPLGKVRPDGCSC